MSVSKWAYDPRYCDGGGCPGDCDLCDKPKNMEDERREGRQMRYIDADKLKAHYAWWQNEDKETFDEIVDAQPTADVRENVRGEWINGFCSICGHEAITEWNETGGEILLSNFCPNCGAQMMRGEA